MSNRDVHAACKRGESQPTGKFAHLLGSVGEFENLSSLGDGSTQLATLRDSRPVRMMFVKNAHSAALLPGAIVSYKTLLAGKQVLYTAASAAALIHGVVDHLLPAAGVPAGYGFLMTIYGPTKFLNDAGGAIGEFDKLIASAAVAGCVKEAGATPTFDHAGYAEETADAGGGAIATATSFWGFFTNPFAG